MKATAFGESYTYRPGQAPPQQDWSASQAYQRGEKMNQTAEQTSDFFVQADNTAIDLDPREGYVRLKDAAAPQLLEETTSTVTGYRTPDGDLQVTGENGGQYQPTTLAISENGKEVYMDRPWYLNDRYLPTLESLSRNDDGSRTFSLSYYQQQF